VRLGRGQRDRLVPLTETAAHWLTRYVPVARPELAAGKLWGKGRSRGNPKSFRQLPRSGSQSLAARLDPQNTSGGFYAYYTAKALDGLGQTDEALKEYQVLLERAKKVEPNSPRVHEVKARLEALKTRKLQAVGP